MFGCSALAHFPLQESNKIPPIIQTGRAPGRSQGLGAGEAWMVVTEDRSLLTVKTPQD